MKSTLAFPKSSFSSNSNSRSPSIVTHNEVTTQGFLATSTLNLGQYLKKNNENNKDNMWVNHLNDKPLL